MGNLHMGNLHIPFAAGLFMGNLDKTPNLQNLSFSVQSFFFLFSLLFLQLDSTILTLSLYTVPIPSICFLAVSIDPWTNLYKQKYGKCKL